MNIRKKIPAEEFHGLNLGRGANTLHTGESTTRRV